MNEDKNTVIGFDNAITYLQSIKFSNYVYIINFQQNMTIFKRILPYIIIVNHNYSVFGITLRYSLFIITLGTSLIFLYKVLKLFKTNPKAVILEQKMTVFLSILTLFFNDPFYIITITKPNPVNNFFSVMFLINALVYLLLFWTTILDRIKDENQMLNSNMLTWKKILFNFIIWILCLTYYVIFAYKNFNYQPLIQASDFNAGSIRYLSILIMLLLAILFIYLVWQHIHIFMKFNQKIQRNKLFVKISLFFILIIIAFNLLFIQVFLYQLLIFMNKMEKKSYYFMSARFICYLHPIDVYTNLKMYQK